MSLTIDPAVTAKYPGLSIGVMTVTGADNTGTRPEVTAMLRAEEEGIRAKMTLETFKDHPHIAAMQEVHRGFGNNPNKYPPSVQALVKRVLKGGELPTINPIVDIYNVISLRYVVCAGAEDTDKCVGPVRLTFAAGGEEFRLIGEEANDPPEAGELVYRDDVGVICRKLNWREGDRTRITETTKNCIVVIEGFAPMSAEALEKALVETAEMLKGFCGAKVNIYCL